MNIIKKGITMGKNNEEFGCRIMKIEGITIYGKNIYLETDDIVDCKMVEQLLRNMIDQKGNPERIRAEALGRVEMIKRNEHNQKGNNDGHSEK